MVLILWFDDSTTVVSGTTLVIDAAKTPFKGLFGYCFRKLFFVLRNKEKNRVNIFGSK